MKYYERIKELREDNDLSQGQLSKMLNIGQQTLSQYESNECENPSEDILKEIEKAEQRKK